MKPQFEKVPRSLDASWNSLRRVLGDGVPFLWHHHPEIELTLTLNCVGSRYIGDSVESFVDGDLVMVGPYLPHTWHSIAPLNERPALVFVLWFRQEWLQGLSDLFVELRDVETMVGRASAGLAFSPGIAATVAPMIKSVFESSNPAEQLPIILRILSILTQDTQATSLASRSTTPAPTVRHSRIDRVLDYIHEHYRESISVADLAKIASLSASGLHRLFRQQLRMTISAYIMRLRVGRACALLSSGNKPIAHIAEEAGYGTIANFERQFVRLQGMTPRAYRAQFKGPKQTLSPEKLGRRFGNKREGQISTTTEDLSPTAMRAVE